MFVILPENFFSPVRCDLPLKTLKLLTEVCLKFVTCIYIYIMRMSEAAYHFPI